MNFIDRQKEIKRLERSLQSEKIRFIVVYGRRRLGKSTLIKKVLKSSDVYFEADLNEPAIQIKLLADTMRMTYPTLADARFDTWDSLLLHFNKICEQNCTLCLDEFPYLVKKNPVLPSILQRLIDSGKLRFNLIICGSSQRMMKKIILDASEPLYGRADEKICLNPIPLPYWKEEMNMSAIEAFEEYSVWGGVPRYWVLREDYDNLWEAVSQLILDEHGALSDEPNSLFIDDGGEVASYSSIMTALGEGKNKFSAIADTIGRKTTDISVPLLNLREMSYVYKEVPFGENQDKSRKTLYRIKDPFMAFYYRFIAPNKSYLALGKIDPLLARIQTSMNSHVSPFWERFCAEAVSLRELFGKEWGMASRWWGNVPIYDENGKPCGHEDIEFDVVAECNDKSSVLIGECKWTAPDFADRLLRTMKAKVAKTPIFANRDIVYVLFLREPPIGDNIPDDVHILYPDDIIRLLKDN